MDDREWSSPGPILDLFLESFRNGQGTKPLLNHLLIVAVDNKAFEYCKSVHPYCFYLSNFAKRHAKNRQFSLLRLKNNFWIEMIELGYNIVYTDADAMWLRNPISQVNVLKQITVACDVHRSDLQSINNITDGGFFYVRSIPSTSNYFKYQDLRRILYASSQDGSLCEETVVSREIFKTLELRFAYVKRDLYGGFCQQNLLLEDWKNFTKKISMEGSSSCFTWKAPSK